MITFICCISFLILGYVVYGRVLEKRFGVDPERTTPAVRLEDGVDYQVLSPWKIFIIQFLNIAGLGPIFGAILGAAYGPMAYLWIVFGCVFMGAAHDFFSGMLSIRNDGMSVPDLIGKYLGRYVKVFMVFFSGLLLIAVGSSFVTGPADLLQNLTGLGKTWWLYIIFAYYILATLVPIDKIIGKIYPVFGLLLLFMAVMVAIMLLVHGAEGDIHLTELSIDSFRNFHSNPDSNILVPMLFVVISCGAISGFHSTQSPLMARCLKNEKYGRPVFYGAMISEGIVAMIWATAAMAYCGGPEGLNAAAADGMTPAILVNGICSSWLGKAGAVIAILGVVVCPITSGDTAFRSLRLTIADALRFPQKSIFNRVLVALPVFVAAYLICMLDFSTIWQFVGISNQILAAIVLWTAAAYLAQKGKDHLYLSVPATFLTFVCVSYLMTAPHKVGGMSLGHTLSYSVGIAAALITFIIFIFLNKPNKH